MTNIIPFEFETHDIRVVTDENGEPLFVGKVIVEALGYANPADDITHHCKGIVKRYPLQTPGGMQDMEPDLYRLVAGSNLQEAA
ncbi:hypothetical protein CCP4SC76_3060005 [Gammaproteobacteria bacterium]